VEEIRDRWQMAEQKKTHRKEERGTLYVQRSQPQRCRWVRILGLRFWDCEWQSRSCRLDAQGQDLRQQRTVEWDMLICTTNRPHAGGIDSQLSCYTTAVSLLVQGAWGLQAERQPAGCDETRREKTPDASSRRWAAHGR
jgi:hypothetical protein